MKHKQFTVVIIVGLALVLAGSAFSAAKKPATMAELALYKGPDRQQILEEGAKKEGKLSFYTAGVLKQAVQPIVDAFEKKYPFLKVEVWRSSGGPMISRALEEYKAGRNLVDTIEGTQNIMFFSQEAGIVQPFYSPNLAHIEEEAITNAPEGGAYAVAFRLGGLGVGYNTKMLGKEQVPKSYQDLLDPKWKRKLVIAGTDSAVNWAGLIYQTFGEEFLRKIAKQEFVVQTVTASALLDLIISGEYAISPTIIDSHVFERRKAGAPVAWVPLEPVRVNVGQIAVAKHAPHPHAALLFADFELSKESGEIHQRVGYDSFRKDLPPLELRYKKYFGNPSAAALKEEYEIFNRLFITK